MNKKLRKPTKEMIRFLKTIGGNDRDKALKALGELANAIQLPIREGLLHGDVLGDIYTVEEIEDGATIQFPLDFFQQGNSGDYIAYTMPEEGGIPRRSVTADEITVDTFTVGNAIDWPLKYARDARWPVVARAMEVFEAGFVRKMNTDGWRTIISAGAGRTDFNGGAPLVFDSAATAGEFTKRLVSLMKTTMTRLAGGNSATPNKSQLTDLYVSVEALEDIRNWDTDEVDDFTRREIFTAENQGGDTPLAQIYGVRLHPLHEFGVGQEFQQFFDGLSLSMGTSDEEIVVGLDLTDDNSFFMPVRESLQVFEDDSMHRRRRAGFYGWQEHGFAVLDPRRVLLGSF